MESVFTYEFITDSLYNRHSELSSSWSFIDYDKIKATVTYTLEDDSDHEVYVYADGNVFAPDVVIKEMDNIAAS